MLGICWLRRNSCGPVVLAGQFDHLSNPAHGPTTRVYETSRRKHRLNESSVCVSEMKRGRPPRRPVSDTSRGWARRGGIRRACEASLGERIPNSERGWRNRTRTPTTYRAVRSAVFSGLNADPGLMADTRGNAMSSGRECVMKAQHSGQRSHADGGFSESPLHTLHRRPTTLGVGPERRPTTAVCGPEPETYAYRRVARVVRFRSQIRECDTRHCWDPSGGLQRMKSDP